MTTYFMNGELYPYSSLPSTAGVATGGSGEGGHSHPYIYCPDRNEYFFPTGSELEKTKVEPHTIICNGYTIHVTPSQRKYGGPPPDWTDTFPGEECEIYCGRLPRDMLEDELLPMFEKFGRIWEFRLMMNEFSNRNRGFAFVRYTTEESATAAIAHLNEKELENRPYRKLRVEACAKKVRLYVANIPKAKPKEELYEEFAQRTKGLKEVIVYAPTDDRDKVKKNRGFCFLDYDSHANAFTAKKNLGKSIRKLWGCELVIDWADPIKEPEEQVMAKVKVLFVRNLTSRVTEDRLQALFSTYGVIERVKRLKDFAFVHFAERSDAEKALREQQGEEFCGTKLQIEWGKPPEDKRDLEETLRARERRMAEGYYCPSTKSSYYAAWYSSSIGSGTDYKQDYYGQAFDPNYYDPTLYYDYYQNYYNYMDYPPPTTNLESTTTNDSGHSTYHPDSSSTPPSSPEVYRRGPRDARDHHDRDQQQTNNTTDLGLPARLSPKTPEADRIHRHRRHRHKADHDDGRKSRRSVKRPSESENWRRGHSSSSAVRDYAHGEPPSPPSPVTPPYSPSNPNSPVHWRRR